jgi:hypothetical protein
MREADVIAFASALEGVLVLRPGPGDGSPEISWGDSFFYYAPDGVVPATQPFATIVTKDYPGEPSSGLDRPGAYRVNVNAGKEPFRRLTGHEPRGPADPSTEPVHDPTAVDVVMAHPVYGELGWLAVVDPGPRTDVVVRELLETAYRLARTRFERRHN